MTQATLPDRFTATQAALELAGQSHVLAFFDRLTDERKEHLLSQIEAIDWPEIAGLIESHVKNKPEFELPENIEPAPCYPFEPTATQADEYRRARELGESLIREGKVAAFTVAGGQGTRLGWDGPKGTFPATPIRGVSLFGCFAEYLLKVKQKYGCACPWYIMTSPVNDAPTRAFFDTNDYFGLDRNDVMMFPQAMMPAIDAATGLALLDSPDSLALSPNGHGGSLKALHTSGALADMNRRGVEQLSYTQVDNPIVRVVDPLFIGLHAAQGCEMSSKMLPKVAPKEKLGNFCLANGRVAVIEYSDLPDELAERRRDDGQLWFRAGSIAIHAISVAFIESLVGGSGFALPFHRADKKVPFVDLATGERVEPQTPNAVKLETFVFDALPMCENSLVYETDRIEEFAPIKNADGTDSADSSRKIQTERAARWLEAAGVKITRDKNGDVDGVIEIQAGTAIEPDDLGACDLPGSIGPGSKTLI